MADRAPCLVAAIPFFGACAVTVDYSGTLYQCTDGSECPPGHTCSEGECRAPAAGAGAEAVADAAPHDALPADLEGSDARGEADGGPLGMVTTTFGEGVTSDTFLRVAAPTFNYGAAPYLRVDADADAVTALVRFETSTVPPRATVIAAELVLWTSESLNAPSSTAVSIHPVLEGWEEGGQDAVAGAASWNERRAGVPWMAPGAGPGSRLAAVVGSFTPNQSLTLFTIVLDPAVVQGWVDDPETNHGLALVLADPDGTYLVSSEGPPGRRPALRVSWIAP